MGRKRGKRRPSAGSAGGGMMRSMRGGFRSAVGKATGGDGGAPSKAGKGSRFWSVLTVVLVIAAALLLASRLGVF